MRQASTTHAQRSAKGQPGGMSASSGTRPGMVASRGLRPSTRGVPRCGRAANTRLLVHAAKLMQRGIAPRTACHGAIAEALTDDAEMLRAIDELASSIF